MEFLLNRHGSSRAASDLTILVQSELCTEVNPLHVLVLREAVGGAAPENYTVVDDVGAVGDPQRFPHVVVRNQHPDAAFLEVENDLLDVGDRDRVDAGEWLIQQDELRGDDQRPGDLDTTPFPARERVRRRLGQWRQTELGQQLALPRLRRAAASSGSVSRIAAMFCSTVKPRKIEASCGR